MQGTHFERPARWPQSIGVVALSVAVLAGAGTVATGVEVALVLLASACALDLVRREVREPGSPVPIAASTAVLLAIAVLFPPQFSHDLWSYAFIGRTLTVHHASPYLHPANTFRHDPFLALVGPAWRRGTTPYGPLFALQAGVVALVGGSHPLIYRLLFQGTAALAIGGALLFSWRTVRKTSTLALLGLQPVISCAVVNGGHNDALIGLGLLLAVMSARRERYASAGGWIAAALLVKATAGLALLPLLGWAWGRGGWRAAGRVAFAPLCVALPVMLTIPGMMHSLSGAKTKVITRASIWNIPLRLLPRAFPGAPRTTTATLITLSLVLVAIVVVSTAWVARRLSDPGVGVVAAITASLVFGAYVLPWYTVWALPAAALRVRSRMTWLVALQGVAVTAVSVIPRPSLPGRTVVSDIVQLAVPAGLAVMFVWAVGPARHTAKGASSPRDPTSSMDARALD